MRPSRWSTRVLLGAVVGIFAMATAGPVSATPLTPTAVPLPNSTFQGGDGDQTDAPPLVRDWQAEEDAGRVAHTSDANAVDSSFASSMENFPGGWQLGAQSGGVSPGQANIRDAWSAVEHVSGDTFLYLAFSRQASGGTTFLAFELNHDTRLWDNGRARIPCRRDGDVQVAYEPRGNTVDVIVRRWATGQSDTATGCARTGRFVDAANPQPNTEAQAAMNGGPIATYLPGVYNNLIPEYRFGEAALNVSRLFERAFGDDCLAFGSIWMHSRSSDQVNSEMQDYVAPRAVSVRTCSASGTKFFDSNANGERDPGESGTPNFIVWADYDNDGVLEPREPFGITDNNGDYVINDIRPPDGTYMLREGLPARRRGIRGVSAGWTCSFPNATTPGGTGSAPGGPFGCAWGPIDARTTPNATGRDFGNWFAPPEPEPPVPPEPETPPDLDPVRPAGPDPPDADAAGRAGARFRQAAAGCIRSRVPRLNLRGTRIASVRIFVNGRLRRGLTVRTLQQRVRPRVTLAPGRYRVEVRVRFQRGTGTPPVTLAGAIRVCGASAPRFTG